MLTLVSRTVAGIDRDGVVQFYQRGMPSASTIIGAMAWGCSGRRWATTFDT
jgi:hypothetical protein